MVTNSKQSWTVGATVKVGFMTLRVTGMSSGLVGKGFKTLPNGYTLETLDGSKKYSFVPHNGLVKI